MSRPAIRVEGLSKEYTIGARDRANETFREMLTASLVAPFRRLRRLAGHAPSEERIWALKDVSFEVSQGEVVGVIGRNGAGKSTLLKILGRITDPTEGRVEIRGRVSSLLEVGTGFHPELTGRENVYLNGAILGMSRAEIGRKFDEIVTFAEVERFLDTPVKRYSSGMSVRLAFAVAAHLEPEILLVDEVLAVGDAAFQRKCLGKMQEVSGEGRTVIFVSHNMQAVQNLCSRSMLLDNGAIDFSGLSSEAVSRHLNRISHPTQTAWTHAAGLGDDSIRLTGLRAYSDSRYSSGDCFPSRNDIVIEMEVDLRRPLQGLCVGFDLIGRDGATVFRSYDTDIAPERLQPLTRGFNRLRCVISGGFLNGGTYAVAPRIGIHNQRWIVNRDPLIGFRVLLNHGDSPYWSDLNESKRPGAVAPILHWRVAQ